MIENLPEVRDVVKVGLTLGEDHPGQRAVAEAVEGRRRLDRDRRNPLSGAGACLAYPSD